MDNEHGTMERPAYATGAHEAIDGATKQPAPAPTGAPAHTVTGRRRVLLGGAGLLGALAGSALLGHADAAASAPERASATAQASTAERQASLRVALAPLKTRGVLWVNHEWEFGARFVGEQPPVVVATAFDDTMEHDPAACCVCAVAVRGEPGAYRATIMVRHIGAFATSVEINAVAIGV